MTEMQGVSHLAGEQTRNPIREPRRSELILAVPQKGSGTVHVDSLRRVREPVSRSKSTVQGKVADVLSGRSRHAESQNELKAFRVLMATGQPDAWQEQPFRLKYRHEGAQHCYTPDILVAWGTHQEVVEIKDDCDAESPENQVRFLLIRELLTEHGFYFRVWKKSEICAEPRLANASLILRYRAMAVPAPDYEGIRRTFSMTPELPLRTFCKHPTTVQNVLRLILDGKLHIDWWEPLTLDSRISSMPIGPQIWPIPPSAYQEPVCRYTD
jgi:hypothetical protein